MANSLNDFTRDPKKVALFAEVERYTAKYKNPYTPQHWIDSRLFVSCAAGSVVGSYFLTAALTAATNFGEVGLFPAVGFVSLMGILTIKTRWSYRKNIRRSNLPRKMAKEFRAWAKKAYNVDIATQHKPMANFFATVLQGKTVTSPATAATFTDTHNKTYVVVTYTAETGRFGVINSKNGSALKPQQQLQTVPSAHKVPDDLVEIRQVSAAAPETVDAEKLPELSIRKAEIDALPSELQAEVRRFMTLYSGLQGLQLITEESYEVDRAVTDMQDAFTLFHTVSRLNGKDPEGVAVSIISQLGDELAGIHERKLAEAKTALAAQQEYVHSRRKTHDSQLFSESSIR